MMQFYQCSYFFRYLPHGCHVLLVIKIISKHKRTGEKLLYLYYFTLDYIFQDWILDNFDEVYLNVVSANGEQGSLFHCGKNKFHLLFGYRLRLGRGSPWIAMSSMTDLIICRTTSDWLATLCQTIPVKLCLSFVMFSSNK